MSFLRRVPGRFSFNLLVYFSVTSLVCFAAISYMAYAMYNRLSRANLVHDYEAYARSIASLLNDVVAREFIRPLVREGRTVDFESSPEQLAGLYGVLADHIHHFPVRKIKIYDTAGRIVYSDDVYLIGLSNPDNEKFRRALSGQVTSFILPKESRADTAGERLSEDLLEVYVPVQDDHYRTVGVFEVYLDVTPLYSRIARTGRTVLLGTLGILGVLYCALLGIVYQGQRIIRRSERRLVEAGEQMARSEERYRATVENISDMVYRLEPEPDWKISYVNSRIQDLAAVAPDDAVGRSVLSLVEPGDRAEFDRVLAALREGVSDSVEIGIRMTGEGGRIVHQIHRVSRWVGADGTLVGFIGIGVDITERIRLEERLVWKKTLVEIMNEVNAVSFASDAPAEPFNAALSRICEFLGFETGFVLLLHQGAERPVALGCASRSPRFAASGLTSAFAGFMRGASFSRLRARGGMSAEDLAAAPETRALAEASGLRAALIRPLASIPGARGIFGLGSAAPGPISQEMLEAAASLGDQIALAVRNIRLFEDVNALSLSDPLTGLANRRHLMIALAQETEVSLRYARPLSVAMADIDRFKAVNDTHGHAIGDEVLKGVAAALRSHSRKADFVARHGGEEFCVILPDTDGDGAVAMCERLRAAVEALSFTGARGERLCVTISFGVSSLRCDAATADDLMLHADAALYAAKRRGRNRVAVYGPPEPLPRDGEG